MFNSGFFFESHLKCCHEKLHTVQDLCLGWTLRSQKRKQLSGIKKMMFAIRASPIYQDFWATSSNWYPKIISARRVVSDTLKYNIFTDAIKI